MPTCRCGERYANERQLSKHKKKCPVVLRARKEAVEYARLDISEEPEPPTKKLRWDLEGIPTLAPGHISFNREDASSSYIREGSRGDHPGASYADLNLEEYPARRTPETDISEQGVPHRTTRAGRVIRPTQKVIDNLPVEPGTVVENPLEVSDTGQSADTEQDAGVRHPRVTLLLTERIKTAANKFGVSRLYKRKPSRLPNAPDLAAIYSPTASRVVASHSRRAISDIISPFPNLSAWLFSHHYWIGGQKKTQGDREAMQSLLARDDFNPADVVGVNFKKLDQDLSASGNVSTIWAPEGEGWKSSDIPIDIPIGQKPTNDALRTAATAQRRADRLETLPDQPVHRPFRGHPYAVKSLWAKNITAELKLALETDPAAANFTFDPCLLFHPKPGSTDELESVYGELYNSPAAVMEDLRLQNSPPEEGCTLPRATIDIILYTDATVVTQFGNVTMWPAYMWIGNQSKYERARPTAHAAHHIAYFPKLPDSIRQKILELQGKPASAALLTHLRRELWQAGWDLIFDDEFMTAYHHGIVVDCADGIRRRVYPRVFLYSADYPEKMLIAALRTKGKHPCPHCGVTFDDIFSSGTDKDKKLRQATRRTDNEDRRRLVEQARTLIYDEGYVVNSDHVDALLKSQSLVPTINTFSAKLSRPGFDFYQMLAPDVMHEVEIGEWKAVFAHLIRILESINAALVIEMDARFRQVPIFGENTIRRFSRNVSDMSNMTAREYEDILQCSIPVFEGLLPEPHNSHVLSLLYSIAYFHCLAKMRLHTETSVVLLDKAYSVMASHLRHFQLVVCPQFQTKETAREFAARVRTQASQSSGVLRGKASSGKASIETSSGRKAQAFNMSTVKMHLMGYYAAYIRLYGTTDGYSTKMGEHEHRRLKARRARTNFRDAESQVAKIDLREARLRRMAQELSALGIDIPGVQPQHPLQEEDIVRPKDHHKIAQESDRRIAIHLREWQLAHSDDPAVEDFGHRLIQHIRSHLLVEVDPAQARSCSLAQGGSIIIKHDRIYRHATAMINFTTYDMQRDQDVVHSNSSDNANDKTGVLVYSPNEAGSPWVYAMVLGIFHTQVLLQDNTEHRVEFLWVRWLELDPSWVAGPATRRLERVRYAAEDTFGFVNPAAVLRGCHLIPAFHHGRDTCELYVDSVAYVPGKDWKYLYVNRFVDRDMGARFAGIGIGNLQMKAPYPDNIEVVAEVEAETRSVISSTSSTDRNTSPVGDIELESTALDDRAGDNSDELNLAALYDDDGDI